MALDLLGETRILTPSPPLAIAFRLAAKWLPMSPFIASTAEEVDRLTGDVAAWFENYAASPVETLFHPNKHDHGCISGYLDSVCRIVDERFWSERFSRPFCRRCSAFSCPLTRSHSAFVGFKRTSPRFIPRLPRRPPCARPSGPPLAWHSLEVAGFRA